MRALAADTRFQTMSQDVAMREIQDTIGAEAPEARQLLEGANIQSPPRSKPMTWLLLTEGAVEVGEATHALEALVGAGGALVAEALATVAAAYEMGSGIAHANQDGLEWGRRIAHGEGFAAAMASRIVGRTGEVPVPAEIAGNPEAVQAYEAGIAEAERNWARLDPSERAALTAGAGNGEVISEIFHRVRERTVHGR